MNSCRRRKARLERRRPSDLMSAQRGREASVPLILFRLAHRRKTTRPPIPGRHRKGTDLQTRLPSSRQSFRAARHHRSQSERPCAQEIFIKPSGNVTLAQSFPANGNGGEAKLAKHGAGGAHSDRLKAKQEWAMQLNWHQ